MESKASYTLTGLFVVVLSTALVIIAFWLSTGVSKLQYHTYVVYMDESVSGLNIRAPVKYNGVNVGRVNHIELNPDNPRQVRLILAVEDTVSVREDTRAALMSQGLTGISFVDLSGGALKSPLLRAKKGEKYPVIQAEPSLLFRLDTVIRELSTSLGALSEEVREVFDSENRLSFKNILKNVDKLSLTLTENATQIDQSIKHLNTTLKNTARSTEQLPDAVASIKKAGSETSFAMQSLNQSLPDVTQVLNQLNQLATDLQRDPSILVRGRQPEASGPGER
jgi:phospholipid/cholesterol/gamma-HCH transport system substrate-binding protein